MATKIIEGLDALKNYLEKEAPANLLPQYRWENFTGGLEFTRAMEKLGGIAKMCAVSADYEPAFISEIFENVESGRISCTYIEHIWVCVRHKPTGLLFHLNDGKTKRSRLFRDRHFDKGWYMLDRFAYDAGHRTGLSEPNCFSKPTAKALDAWVKYYLDYEAEVRALYGAFQAKRDAFIADMDRRGVKDMAWSENGSKARIDMYGLELIVYLYKKGDGMSVQWKPDFYAERNLDAFFACADALRGLQVKE